MFDLVGQPVQIGDYISYSGSGNSDCRYGMVVGKVTKVTEEKVYITTLSVNYPKQKPIIKLVKTTKNIGKFVVVFPSTYMRTKLDRWFSGDFSGDENIIAFWLHKGFIKV